MSHFSQVTDSLAQHINIDMLPEDVWQVFDNHINTLFERIAQDEQYNEEIIEFEVADEAKTILMEIVPIIKQMYGKEVTPFEQSMILLHIGRMVEENEKK